MQRIDALLNKFTMYRVVLYGLLVLSASAIVFSFFGLLSFKPESLIFSFVLILSVCYFSNKLFAILFKVPSNTESFFITSLILFLILIPVDSRQTFMFYAGAGVIAMTSKYLLIINKRHIFNPAALALFVIGVLGSGQSSWWISSQFMFPLVLIVGLLIVRKVRRFHLFFSFFIISVITTLIFSVINKSNPIEILPLIITSYPLLFLGSVMLTEPLTTPPSKRLQMIYGVIVGFFAGAQFHIGVIFATPELALLIGNVFSYGVSFKRRITLTLKEKIQISPNIYEFIFSPNYKFAYLPGQYLEWTLGHKSPDQRGVRRYFTIASSPTEENLRLGVRIDSSKSSSFKKALVSLNPGVKLFAGSLSGDFVLPEKANKYIFIAGGIGITPFRSMIKNLVDKKEKSDIVLFYSSADPKDFVYKSIFDEALKIDVKTVYIASHPDSDWKGKSGRIDANLIKQEVPDFKERIYYLSGPNSMIQSYKDLLESIGISKTRIVTDYFPGY